MVLLILSGVWKGNSDSMVVSFPGAVFSLLSLYLSPSFIIACASKMDKMEVLVCKAMLHKYLCSKLQDVLAVEGSQTEATSELSSGNICD